MRFWYSDFVESKVTIILETNIINNRNKKLKHIY